MGRRDNIISLNSNDMDASSPLGTRLRQARLRKNISLTEMARRIGYTKSHLSAVENNIGTPSTAVIQGYADELALVLNELIGVQSPEQPLSREQPKTVSTQEQSLQQQDDTYQKRERPKRKVVRQSPVSLEKQPTPHEKNDWGEASKVIHFYGRQEELAYLRQSMTVDNCRLIAIVGIGGVGKTTLAAKVARQLQEEQEKFEYVFWRSLQHVSSLESILEKCIIFLSDQKLTSIPKDESEQLLLLLDYLRKKRCLLVLDNFESVLQIGSSAGSYKKGYEGYGKLISLLGEAEHQSCLLITSREKPREIVSMEGKRNLIRSVGLFGLTEAQGQEILQGEGLYGSSEAWKKLIILYSGNPLALKLVSEPVRDLFNGSIEAFLKEEEVVVGDIHLLLEQQFSRLSSQEQEIMYWLATERATERDTLHLDALQQEVTYSVSKSALLELLKSLRRRFMIETYETAQFFMQPAIMEYVTNIFVKKIHDEICSEEISLFNSHILLKAQAKDYIREAQKQLILEPLIHQLYLSLGREGSKAKLKGILKRLSLTHQYTPGYAAGNILNLLIYLQADLDHTDFSDLVVWQAYLQGVSLHDTNFSHADLQHSVFTETFGRILSVTVSTSGNYLAAGSANGEIRLWDIHSGTPLQTFVGHTDWVRAIAFSPDEQTIVSGSDDQSVRVWDVKRGICTKELFGHTGRVYSVAFHPDSNMVVSCSEDQTIRLYDLRTGAPPKILKGHTSRVYAVAISPDRKTLASCGEDQSVRIWDLHTGRSKTLNGHTGRVWSISFSHDGKLLASGGVDQTVRVWDLRTSRIIQERNEHNCTIYSVAFSADDKILASGGDDCNIHLWETSNWQHTRLLTGHTDRVRSIAFNPAGNMLITGGDDQSIRIWDTEKDVCIRTVKGQSNWIYSVAFSPDGTLIASGGDDRCIHLWNVQDGKDIYTFEGHKYRVRSVAFSPDGKTLASASEDQTVRLWNLKNEHPPAILQGHTDWLYSAVFSPDGQRIASSSEDQSVRIWDVKTGQCLGVLKGHTDWVRAVSFHPNGKVLASASEDQTIRLWNTETFSTIDVLRDHTNRVWSVNFSPDGKKLVSGSDDYCVRIWDIEHNNEALKILDGHEGRVWFVTYNPDGTRIASGSEDKTVRIWDASTGKLLHVLKGHTSRVCTVAYSPDGHYLASASHDGTILLWNQAGQCIRTLQKDRLYERMNITGVRALTEAQKGMLKDLGAIEDKIN